jgi:hypothetical protein
MSVKEYAARHGVTLKAVKIWIYEGKITHVEKVGRAYVIDPVRCDEDLKSNQNPSYQKTSAENGARNGAKDKPTAAKTKTRISSASSLADIKKAQARVDLERKTLELQKTKGILVEKARVYDALFEFAQKVRGRVRAVPARIVDDLLASPDRVDALRILSEALDEALNDLADADDKNLKI